MDDEHALKQLLAYAIETYPQNVEILPVERLVIDSARESGQRPAYVKIAVPDGMVQSLRGRRESSDQYLLVRIPKDVEKRAASPIILPGEVRNR